MPPRHKAMPSHNQLRWFVRQFNQKFLSPGLCKATVAKWILEHYAMRAQGTVEEPTAIEENDSGKEQEYFKMLNAIEKRINNVPLLKQAIAVIQDKRQRGVEITASEQEILEIELFCHSLALMQVPNLYEDFLPRGIQQDNIDITANLIRPAALENDEMIVLSAEVHAFPTMEDLHDYLQALSELFANNQAIPLMLDNFSHTIGAIYRNNAPEHPWEVFDINGLKHCPSPNHLIPANNTTLVDDLFVLFDEKSECIIFRTIVLIPKTITLRVGFLEELIKLEKQYAIIDEKTINILNNNREGLVHFLCRASEDLGKLKSVLQYKIDINQHTNRKLTPLMIASVQGNSKAVKFLLKQDKIDVNLGPADYYTPLFGACIHNQYEVILLLLQDINIDVNKAVYNKTPLMYLCEQGDLRGVKLLLTHPDLNVNKSYIISTPLTIACDHNYKKIVKLLLPKAKLNIININYCLHEAATAHSIWLKLLLQNKSFSTAIDTAIAKTFTQTQLFLTHIQRLQLNPKDFIPVQTWHNLLQWTLDNKQGEALTYLITTELATRARQSFSCNFFCASLPNKYQGYAFTELVEAAKRQDYTVCELFTELGWISKKTNLIGRSKYTGMQALENLIPTLHPSPVQPNEIPSRISGPGHHHLIY